MKEWDEGRMEERMGRGDGRKEQGEKNAEGIFRVFRHVDRLVHLKGRKERRKEKGKKEGRKEGGIFRIFRHVDRLVHLEGRKEGRKERRKEGDTGPG